MAKARQQLVVDEDLHAEVTLKIPMPLYRTLHAYCVFRDLPSDRFQVVATGAMRAYFADNTPFQTWLRGCSNLPDPPPPTTARRRRSRGTTARERQGR